MAVEKKKFKKFSFKKNKVGLWETETDIKLDKKKVGYIRENRKDNRFHIYFAVDKPQTEADPCRFKWIKFKSTFDCEQSARDFIIFRNDTIQKTYKLYFLD